MKRYTFDVQMFATVEITAGSERQARALLATFDGPESLATGIDNVAMTSCSVEDHDPELTDEEEL